MFPATMGSNPPDGLPLPSCDSFVRIAHLGIGREEEASVKYSVHYVETGQPHFQNPEGKRTYIHEHPSTSKEDATLAMCDRPSA